MSVKTLNANQLFNAPAHSPRRLTYSIDPLPASPHIHGSQESEAPPTELEVFLDNENPLGCLRGVMWVMGFNMVAFLVAFTVWVSLRFL
jgi:hypothetical protein